MEQVFGKSRLGLITPTLPNIPEYLPYWVKGWDNLIRQLLQEIQRELKRLGAPIHYVGVDELHPKRSAELGYGVLHSHLLIVAWDGKSYKSDGKREYYIHADKLRVIWYRVLTNYCRKLEIFDSSIPMPKARIEIASIKKSAEGYLGKYLSKGVGNLRKATSENKKMEVFARHWWHCSKELRDTIKGNIESVPIDILKAILQGVDLTSRSVTYYLRPIKRVINSVSLNRENPLEPIENREETLVGYTFKLTEKWRNPLEDELIQSLNSC